MSGIYINLVGPYKYIKRAPSSLPFHSSIISYIESGTGHFVYHAVLLIQPNLTTSCVHYCTCCSREYNKDSHGVFMNLIILPQILPICCFLGIASDSTSVFILFANCSSHFFLKTSRLLFFPLRIGTRFFIPLPLGPNALPTLTSMVSVNALLIHLPHLCCPSTLNSIHQRHVMLVPHRSGQASSVL